MLSKYLVVSSMYAYSFIPIFSLGYNLSNRPMNSKLLNFMENMNEFFILFNLYFIPIYTQWICDPVQKYEYAFIQIFGFAIVMFINFSLIIFELLKAMKRYRDKKHWLREWNIFFSYVLRAKIEAKN